MWKNLRYKAIVTASGSWLEDVETGEQIRPLIGAKGDVHVPPPSAEETQLKKANLELINKQKELAGRQQQEYDAMLPHMYADAGYKYSKDANGAAVIARMTDDERRARMTPAELQTYEIQTMANDRTKRALEGKLDVDPSVESDIQRGEQQLRQELLRKLGPGAEGSDSWNRAMAEYTKQMDMVRYSVRHGEMTTADAIGSNRANESMRRQEQTLSQSRSSAGGNQAGAGLLAQATGAGEGALNRMYGQRIDAADLQMQNNQRKDAFWGGIVQGGMGMGGAAAGAGAAILV